MQNQPFIRFYDDVNPDTGTHFYIAMHNPSNATTDDAFAFPISTGDGSYTIPHSGTLRLDGQDSKILPGQRPREGRPDEIGRAHV